MTVCGIGSVHALIVANTPKGDKANSDLSMVVNEFYIYKFIIISPVNTVNIYLN